MHNNSPKSDKSFISTGPTSDIGKAISSRNSLKHGCCAASTLILPHENEADYKALEATWLNAYHPQSDPERHLVQELVNADWLLQRTTAAYAKVEADLYILNPNPSGWTESHERKLGRYLRYRTAQSNLVAKARKAVEDFRKARLNEKAQAEKQTIAQERLKIYKHKNRPEADSKEHLPSRHEKRSRSASRPLLPLLFDQQKDLIKRSENFKTVARYGINPPADRLATTKSFSAPPIQSFPPLYPVTDSLLSRLRGPVMPNF